MHISKVSAPLEAKQTQLFVNEMSVLKEMEWNVQWAPRIIKTFSLKEEKLISIGPANLKNYYQTFRQQKQHMLLPHQMLHTGCLKREDSTIHFTKQDKEVLKSPRQSRPCTREWGWKRTNRVSNMVPDTQRLAKVGEEISSHSTCILGKNQCQPNHSITNTGQLCLQTALGTLMQSYPSLSERILAFRILLTHSLQILHLLLRNPDYLLIQACPMQRSWIWNPAPTAAKSFNVWKRSKCMVLRPVAGLQLELLANNESTISVAKFLDRYSGWLQIRSFSGVGKRSWW